VSLLVIGLGSYTFLKVPGATRVHPGPAASTVPWYGCRNSIPSSSMVQPGARVRTPLRLSDHTSAYARAVAYRAGIAFTVQGRTGQCTRSVRVLDRLPPTITHRGSGKRPVRRT
jgi:hypothetical protein